MGMIYATSLASAGYASSAMEVLRTWPPGMVLAAVDQIAWRNDQQEADLEARRGT